MMYGIARFLYSLAGSIGYWIGRIRFYRLAVIVTFLPFILPYLWLVLQVVLLLIEVMVHGILGVAYCMPIIYHNTPLLYDEHSTSYFDAALQVNDAIIPDVPIEPEEEVLRRSFAAYDQHFSRAIEAKYPEVTILPPQTPIVFGKLAPVTEGGVISGYSLQFYSNPSRFATEASDLPISVEGSTILPLTLKYEDGTFLYSAAVKEPIAFRFLLEYGHYTRVITPAEFNGIPASQLVNSGYMFDYANNFISGDGCPRHLTLPPINELFGGFEGSSEESASD
jgi:hypothetical protein